MRKLLVVVLVLALIGGWSVRDDLHIPGIGGGGSTMSVDCAHVDREACANMKIGRKMNADKFGDQYWSDLRYIWMHESGWHQDAVYAATSDYGIPQMHDKPELLQMTVRQQIAAGLEYIATRYDNPHKARLFWDCRGHWRCCSNLGCVKDKDHGWY